MPWSHAADQGHRKRLDGQRAQAGQSVVPAQPVSGQPPLQAAWRDDLCIYTGRSESTQLNFRTNSFLLLGVSSFMKRDKKAKL